MFPTWPWRILADQTNVRSLKSESRDWKLDQQLVRGGPLSATANLTVDM